MHCTTPVALSRFRGVGLPDGPPAAVCDWSALRRSRVARRPLERVVGHLLLARLDTGEAARWLLRAWTTTWWPSSSKEVAALRPSPGRSR